MFIKKSINIIILFQFNLQKIIQNTNNIQIFYLKKILHRFSAYNKNTLIKQMQKDPDYKKPQFRFPYQQCKQHYQKLNYICLNKQCHQNSLICSICKDSQKHIKHQIRPLKFYLQQLENKYKNTSKNDIDFEEMLQQLQISQYTFYQKLKNTVQTIAEQFKKLQEQVTQQISKIRNQILQEISKRHKFNQFYQSLKKGNIDNSNFLIQNYLPQPSVGKLGNLQTLDAVTIDICSKIQQIKQDIVYRKSVSFLQNSKLDKTFMAFNHLNLQTALKKPANMSFIGNVLTQTISGALKSICLINYPLANLSGRISLKVLQFKKGSQIIIGAMTRQVYDSMNGQNWQVVKLKNDCFAVGNDGYKYGWQSNQINQFSQGSSLQLFSKGGQFKVTQKNKTAIGKLPTNTDLFIFIVLTGQSQIRINHIK